MKSNKNQRLTARILIGLTVLGSACVLPAGTVSAMPTEVGTVEDGTYVANHDGVAGKVSAKENAEADDASLLIKKGGVVQCADGGGAVGFGTGAKAERNTLTIDVGGRVEDRAVGGYASSISRNVVTVADGNNVVMNGSAGGVYGGFALGVDGTETAAEANKNTVTLMSGDGLKGCFGGSAEGGIRAAANGNHVIVKDGTYTKVNITGGSATLEGSEGTAEANGNIVDITGGTFTGNSVVIGGVVSGRNGAGLTVSASDNIVNLSAGKFSNIAAGQAQLGAANGNTVNLLEGSVVTETVLGGAGQTAMGNIINIQGGKFVPVDAYGRVLVMAGVGNSATNNIINLRSDAANAYLLGGMLANTGSKDIVTGNTLNVYAKDLTAVCIGNFGNINFYLPDTVRSGDTMLQLTGSNFMKKEIADSVAAGTEEQLSGLEICGFTRTGAINLTKTTICAGVAGNAALRSQDTVTLLKAADGCGLSFSDIKATGNLEEGVSLKYAMDIRKASDTAIVATITKSPNDGLEPQTKSLVETAAGTAALANSGADFTASTGMAQASAAAGASGAQGMTPFFASGGSTMRANTGSYVDMKGLNMTLGFAREVKNAPGKLLYGPMFEYGAGSYTSHLDDGTRGDGNSHYYGAGVFAKEQRNDGFYYEGSLRAGRTTADYRSYDLKGVTSTSDGHVSYDTSNSYWGAHLGAGHVTKLTNGDSVDLYGKYFYGHTSGTDADLSSGETYHFDAVNSHRLRLGGRYTHAMNAISSVYAGAAYQYEFGGDARASYKGYDTATPSLKGGSGMLELGWLVKPSKTSPVTVDLGLTGWAGKQQGLSVQAGAQWAF